MARYIDYAKIPMGKNDIGAKTIGEYFEKLLLTLWDEQEDFSGKRPFGNSGWEYDVYASLISAGVVDGSLDEEGYVSNVAYSAANDIVCEMIKQIFASDADVVPKSEDGLILTIDGASGYFPKEFIIEAIKTHMSQSKGEWKWISDDDVICSACGSVFYTDDNADAGTSLWHFCPKCGAKMKGGAK